MQALILSRRGAKRLLQGHPWIYRSDLVEDPASALASGAAVELRDERGRSLGSALYSAHSQIALRLFSREVEALDPAFLRRRIQAALELRSQLFPEQRFLRLVHAEADGLPGLVVDRYGEVLCVQTSHPGMEGQLSGICDLLEELLSPPAILERNDHRPRHWERLELRKGLLRGSYQAPTLWQEGTVCMELDLLEEEGTGAFLEQRENHLLAGQIAKGRALDLFANAGAFALQMAAQASEVRAVELSEAGCQRLRRNVARSGLEQIETVEGNAFDWLRDELAAGGRYDTIVLDPPAFARGRAALPAARRAYKELNLRSFQLLAAGGLFMTFSRSFHLDADAFEELVLAAAMDAGREVQLLERLGAGKDHPERLGLQESRTLKGLLLRAL